MEGSNHETNPASHGQIYEDDLKLPSPTLSMNVPLHSTYNGKDSSSAHACLQSNINISLIR